MRKITFFFIMLFSFTGACAQDWAPTGATWYYTQTQWGPGFPVSYWGYQSTNDTIIQGKNCKTMSFFNASGSNFTSSYIYTDSNRVYALDAQSQTFQLVYDMNVSAGGTWIARVGTDSVVVTVDSTGQEIINSDTLRVQYISEGWGQAISFFSNKVIDKIGGNGLFFPVYTMIDPTPGPLRCYTDTIIGHYETGVASSCTYTTGIEDITAANITVYPDPASSSVTVSMNITQPATASVVDCFGRKMNTTILSSMETTIDITAYPRGIYFMEIRSGSSTIIKKIVKD